MFSDEERDLISYPKVLLCLFHTLTYSDRLSWEKIISPCRATNKNCNKREPNSKNYNKRSDDDAVHISSALVFSLDILNRKFLGIFDLIKGLCIANYCLSCSFNRTLKFMWGLE